MAMGAVQTLALETAAQIDLAQAARYFGQPNAPDGATLSLLERCAVGIRAAAAPRAVWLAGDAADFAAEGLLQGQDIAAHLRGCDRAVLLAVTLGAGVDRQIHLAGIGDIAAGVASDALASALAEQMADAAEKALRQWAAEQGRYLTFRFSPGYGDWPIAVQPLVAELLDSPRRIGLHVTDSCLLMPRKSVTALLGVSLQPVKGRLAGCGHCALRERCDYRKRGKSCADL